MTSNVKPVQPLSATIALLFLVLLAFIVRLIQRFRNKTKLKSQVGSTIKKDLDDYTDGETAYPV